MTRTTNCTLIFLAALLGGWPAHAREIAGMEVPEMVRMDGSDGVYHLSGAAVREHNFTPLYVTALYLANGGNGEIPDEYTDKQITLIWLTPSLSDERVDEYWREALARSLDDERQFARIRSAVDRFVSMIDGVAHGDTFVFEYVPDRGTQLFVNGDKVGNLTGMDFHRALMGIWFADDPQLAPFQRELLGKS